MSKPTPFHERCYSGSPPAFPEKGGSARPLHHGVGTLLKQQIPIRTFEEWKETRPGFLEADLVAHCGTDIEGGYLYTLTLTDVATGWTECLPLLYRSQEAVLTAIQRSRTLFPFPILGIDTDGSVAKNFKLIKMVSVITGVSKFCKRKEEPFLRVSPLKI